MPKSVLHYVLDKDQYFNPETSFTHCCMEAALLVSTCMEQIPDKFSREERRELKIL